MSIPRLGLIGAGAWGKVCLRALAALPEVRLVAVASSNPMLSATLGDCPVFGHWDALLNSGLCDGVVITTPPHTHADIVIAALERGIAVFVEKPLSLCPDQARAVRAVGLRVGLPLVVDHIHLFSPSFRRLRQLVTELGPIRSVTGLAGKPGAGRPGLSVLWDWGVHDVAMCLALLGREPDNVHAMISARPRFSDGDGEIVDLDLDFGGVPARFRIGTLEQRHRLLRVECDGATLVYDDLAASKLTLDDKAVKVASDRPLQVALREFAASIGQGDLDRAGLDLAVAAVDVLARAERKLT